MRPGAETIPIREGGTVNKSDFIDHVMGNMETEGTDVTKKLVGQVYDATFDALKQALKADGKLTIPGFGTFVVKGRPERPGRNPRTGAPMTLKASKTVQFKPTPALKEALK